MTTQPSRNEYQDQSYLTVLRVLLLIQGGIGVASFLEVLVAGASQGLVLFPILAMTGGGAAASLWLATRLPRLGRRARRAVLLVQYFWLATATVDLLLSVFMTQRLLELVPVLTRIVLPLALIRSLRSSRSRLLFAVPPSRRARRKARRLARRQTKAAAKSEPASGLQVGDFQGAGV